MRWVTLAALLAMTPAVPAAPVVLVLVLDGVRADDLGCYGAGAPVSPTIDALCASGIVFTRADAPRSPADTAVVSLLTSRLASAATADDPTLATVLSGAGAVTVGITTNADDESRGRLRGFGTVATVPPEAGAASPSVGFKGADHDAFPLLFWMQGHRRELRTKAVFLWWRQDVTGLGRLPTPGFLRRFLPPPRAVGLAAVAQRLLAGEMHFASAEVAQLAAAHEAAIAQADAALAQVLERLRAADIARRLWVIVTACTDAARWEQATGLDDEVRHVPLIVLPPLGGPGPRRSDAPVGLIDLAPTVLSLAGVPAPAEFQGRDLTPILRGQ